jgi:group I intron endonuclease
MYFLYEIRRKNNGKVYIGKTSRTVEWRWQRHINDAFAGKGNARFPQALRKYGPDAFDVCQINCAETEEEINELEKLYISIHRSFLPQKGYNMRLGGDGGQWSEESRRLKSEQVRGKNNPRFGQKCSEETKEKIRRTQLGSTKPPRPGQSVGEKNHMFGRKHSPEAIAKMSGPRESLQGKNHPGYRHDITDEIITKTLAETGGTFKAAQRLNCSQGLVAGRARRLGLIGPRA